MKVNNEEFLVIFKEEKEVLNIDRNKNKKFLIVEYKGSLSKDKSYYKDINEKIEKYINLEYESLQGINRVGLETIENINVNKLKLRINKIVNVFDLKKMLNYKSLLIGVSIIGYFFYQLAYCFLYGFYFGGGSDEKISLLNMIVNPVPIKFQSGIILGSVFFILFMITIIPNFRILSDRVKIEEESLVLIIIQIVVAIFVTIISCILFTGGNIKNSYKMLNMFFSIWIVPSYTLMLFINFRLLLQNICKYISSFMIALIIVITMYKNIDFPEYIQKELILLYVSFYIQTIITILVFKLIKNIKFNIYLLYNKSRNNKNNTKLKNKKSKNRIRFIDILSMSISVLIVLGSFISIPYSSFQCGKFARKIIMDEYIDCIIYDNSDLGIETNMILGNIVAQDQNIYYISKYPEKKLMTIKSSKVVSIPCPKLKFNKEYKEYKEKTESWVNNYIKENSIDKDLINIKFHKADRKYINYNQIELKNGEGKFTNGYVFDDLGNLSKLIITYSINLKNKSSFEVNNIKNFEKNYLEFLCGYYGIEKLNLEKSVSYYTNGKIIYTEKNDDGVKTVNYALEIY